MHPQRRHHGIGRGPFLGLALGLSLTLAACSGSDGLRQLNRPPTGPDEFKVVPAKPLSEPESYTFLPVPTPGATNRTDPTPTADAVVELGGSAAALQPAASIPARDGAIVNYSSRYGVTPNIRQVLAESDAEFRNRKARFTNIRIVPVDRYNQAYQQFALNPFAEADRFRRAGIRTPSAPPPTNQ